MSVLLLLQQNNKQHETLLPTSGSLLSPLLSQHSLNVEATVFEAHHLKLLHASFVFGFLRTLAFHFCVVFCMLLVDWHRCLVCCCSSLADRHLKHQSEISCKKPRCWKHMVLIPIHARFFKHLCTIYRLQNFKSDCFFQLVTPRICGKHMSTCGLNLSKMCSIF